MSKSSKRTARKIQKLLKTRQINYVILSWPENKGYRGITINSVVYVPLYRFEIWSETNHPHDGWWKGSDSNIWRILFRACKKAHFIKTYSNAGKRCWRDID